MNEKKYYHISEVKAILREFISNSNLHKRGKKRLELAKQGCLGGLDNDCSIHAVYDATKDDSDPDKNHKYKKKVVDAFLKQMDHPTNPYNPDRTVRMSTTRNAVRKLGWKVKRINPESKFINRSSGANVARISDIIKKSSRKKNYIAGGVATDPNTGIPMGLHSFNIKNKKFHDSAGQIRNSESPVIDLLSIKKKNYYTKEEVKSILREFISNSTLHQRGRRKDWRYGNFAGVSDSCAFHAIHKLTGKSKKKVVDAALHHVNHPETPYNVGEGVSGQLMLNIIHKLGHTTKQVDPEKHVTYIKDKKGKITGYKPHGAAAIMKKFPNENHLAVTWHPTEQHIVDNKKRSIYRAGSKTKKRLPDQGHAFAMTDNKIHDPTGAANNFTQVAALWKVKKRSRNMNEDIDSENDRDKKIKHYVKNGNNYADACHIAHARRETYMDENGMTLDKHWNHPHIGRMLDFSSHYWNASQAAFKAAEAHMDAKYHEKNSSSDNKSIWKKNAAILNARIESENADNHENVLNKFVGKSRIREKIHNSIMNNAQSFSDALHNLDKKRRKIKEEKDTDNENDRDKEIKRHMKNRKMFKSAHEFMFGDGSRSAIGRHINTSDYIHLHELYGNQYSASSDAARAHIKAKYHEQYSSPDNPARNSAIDSASGKSKIADRQHDILKKLLKDNPKVKQFHNKVMNKIKNIKPVPIHKKSTIPKADGAFLNLKSSCVPQSIYHATKPRPRHSDNHPENRNHKKRIINAMMRLPDWKPGDGANQNQQDKVLNKIGWKQKKLKLYNSIWAKNLTAGEIAKKHRSKNIIAHSHWKHHITGEVTGHAFNIKFGKVRDRSNIDDENSHISEAYHLTPMRESDYNPKDKNNK